MYVTPGQRGKGIGKALIETAINQALELDCVTKINLTVVPINQRSKAPYRNFRFETYGLE